MPQNIEDMKNITKERIVLAYAKFGTARKTAEVLGITHPTVTKYLRMEGITIRPSGWVTTHELYSGKSRIKTSLFAKWLKKNPTKRLPRDITEMAKVTGIGRNIIKCYLYARYQRAKYLIEKLGPLNDYDVKLIASSTTKKDYKYSLQNLTRYKAHLDKFDHTVRITGVVEAQEGDFFVPYKPINIFELYDLCVGE